MCDCFVQPTLLGQCTPEVVVDLCGLGIDLQNLLEMRNRFAEPSFLEQSGPKVVAGLGGIGIGLQNLPEMGDCFVETLCLNQGNCQVVVGLGGFGTDLQRLFPLDDGGLVLAVLPQSGCSARIPCICPMSSALRSRPCTTMTPVMVHMAGHDRSPSPAEKQTLFRWTSWGAVQSCRWHHGDAYLSRYGQ